MEPHPEGGHYKRVYASDALAEDGRPLMTSIYYLLECGDISALHRLKMDEQWHFYAGSPITIHEIAPDGTYRSTTLGIDCFQYTVQAGHYFGATTREGFALVGCVVVPGFHFDDFEMPSQFELLVLYPQHTELIQCLTR